MRASTLKAKYPDLWKAVEREAALAIKMGLMGVKIEPYRVKAMAHNTAFNVCYHVHKHGVGGE